MAAEFKCTNCGKPVDLVKGLLWVCEPSCYLDWFRRLLGRVLPNTQGWVDE